MALLKYPHIVHIAFCCHLKLHPSKHVSVIKQWMELFLSSPLPFPHFSWCYHFLFICEKITKLSFMISLQHNWVHYCSLTDSLLNQSALTGGTPTKVFKEQMVTLELWLSSQNPTQHPQVGVVFVCVSVCVILCYFKHLMGLFYNALWHFTYREHYVHFKLLYKFYMSTLSHCIHDKIYPTVKV